MKRELMTILIGAALVGATEADAQRVRGGNGDRDRGPVERLEPVRAPGRVTAPRASRVERVYRTAPRRGATRSRVVYSSRSYPRYGRSAAWVRVDWGRAVRFRVVNSRRYRGVLNAGDLRHLVGSRTVRLIREAGRDAGLRGALRGRWVAEPGLGRVLVVTMGGADVAEMLDYDRDGFVDDVWLIGHGGYRTVYSPR